MSTNICKLLVVDDEFIIRQGIIHFLDWQSHGYCIVGEASNGKEALEAIEKEKPHIVICDIVMPLVDGITLSKKIKDEYPDIKIIVLSSYGDFDNVKKMFLNGASDYILKPTLNPEMLLKSLSKVRSGIESECFVTEQESTLHNFLTQSLLGYEVKSNIEDIFLTKKYYKLLLIQHKRLEHKDLLDTYYDELDVLIKQDIQYQVLKISDEIHAIIFASDNKLHNIVIENNILQDELNNCIFAISDVFASLDSLKDINKETLTYFESRFYLNTAIITSENSITFSKLNRFDIYNYNEMLHRLQLQEGLQYLHNFVDDALKKKARKQELKAVVGNALYTFISVMEEHDIDSSYIKEFKLTTLGRLESSLDSCAYLQEFEKIMSDLSIIVENYYLEKNEDVMNQIIKYMHLNYKLSLSLDLIAKEFNFSYSYLSAYFNERSDKSFSEYLNYIRINKAAELLRSGNANISEVGYEVGFSDHSYFCKVFKKQIGVTPSVYRRGGTFHVT